MNIMLTEETAKTAIKCLFKSIKIGAEAFALEQDPPIDDKLDDFVDSTKFYLEDIEKACQQIRSHLENYFEDLESDMYDEFIDEEEAENECDVFQIGGICTEKNCAHCINHSGFCPIDEDK